jgi:hypothetical protein
MLRLSQGVPPHVIFFAFLDRRSMRFADPVFIVPSAEVHKHAIPHLHDDTWHFDFHASLGPKAHDHWEPYRVNTLDIGKRILSIIQNLEKDRLDASSSAALLDRSDLVWVGKRNAAA